MNFPCHDFEQYFAIWAKAYIMLSIGFDNFRNKAESIIVTNIDHHFQNIGGEI